MSGTSEGRSVADIHSKRKSAPAAIQPARLKGHGMVAYLLLIVALGVSYWKLMSQLWRLKETGAPIWAILGYSLALAVIVVTLVALLTLAGLGLATLPKAWAYRTAFLLGTGLALTQFLWVSFTNHQGPFWPLLVIPILAAFLGGMSITGLQMGLMEDNFPPPEKLKERVMQKHALLLGVVPPVPRAKRLFDIALASFGILASAPVWLLISLLIWLEDPGPLLFIKNSVGLCGVNFRQYKFRTMVLDAEGETGPILARQTDERVLWLGRLLRKTALDELPQLINILRGEMSFVGPRPQRTVLVAAYLDQIPNYALRHRVLPGIAGLAQIAGDYYTPARNKLRYDLLYARHASLCFDIKLIALACLIVFWLRWKKVTVGRVPRSWIKFRL